MTSSTGRAERFRLGTTLFDPASQMLTDPTGRPIDLRDKSLRVLTELARRNGMTVAKDDLIEAAWDGRSVSDDSLVQCIRDISSAIGDTDRRLLRTAVGRGYSLHGTREMPLSEGTPPTILIAPLRGVGGGTRVAELAEVITEEMIIALSPRAGMKVTTDEARRDDALYVVSGRVSQQGADIRAFVQLSRG